MIRVLEMVYTDELPMRPADADFGVTIDFVRGQSDPVQVFAAMTDLLWAFAEMDTLLIGAVAPDIEPITVIEDVEAASITAWVRNKLSKVDDQALKEFDPKQQVGVYAVKAKYRILKYLDERIERQREERLERLREDLTALAAPVTRGFLPPTIDMKALSPPMNRVQSAKARLTKGEKVTVKADVEPEYTLDTTSTAPVGLPIEDDQPSIRDTAGEMEMVLLVRKADFLGKSRWEFKHGKSTIPANIEDADWLDRFHEGLERLVPGASLRLTVRYKYEYDDGGQLAHSKYDVIKVHAMVPPDPLQQEELFRRS